MKVTYKRESAIDCIPELEPLFEKHWEEIAHYKDIPARPDYPTYLAADAGGFLRLYTARTEDGVMIGYAVFFVRYNIHYMDSLQAMQDLLFVHPDYRKGRVGIKLIQFCDDQLRADGVQVVYQHVKLNHDFGPLLKRLGYEPVEMIHGKRLDRG